MENLVSWERLSYFYTSTSAKTLSLGSQLYTRIWVRVTIGLLKKPLFDWSIRVKGNPKITSGNSLGFGRSLEAPEQRSWRCSTDVTGWGPRSRLRLECRRSYPRLHGACRVRSYKGLSSSRYTLFSHSTHNKKKQSIAMAQMQRQTFSCTEFAFYFTCLKSFYEILSLY